MLENARLRTQAEELRDELADAREVLVEMDKIVAQLRAAPNETDEKNEAYRQRNHLVAALARLYPSGTMKTAILGWDPEWCGCCYIDLPTGQVSYHFHDSQAFLFDDLPPYCGKWDGHDKETVHDRLSKLAAPLKAKI